MGDVGAKGGLIGLHEQIKGRVFRLALFAYLLTSEKADLLILILINLFVLLEVDDGQTYH